jgi:holo-[acyl-carrier protein] synthase
MTHNARTSNCRLERASRLGFDLVQISGIGESIRAFGDAFTQRVFTHDELAYARRGEGLMAERLAARFAAKEAVIKALQLSEAGIAWHDIEVHKREDGSCDVRLHGRAAAAAAAMGVDELLLSLTHDGDYAAAMVLAHGAAPASDFHQNGAV